MKKYTILLLSIFLYGSLIATKQPKSITVFAHGIGGNKYQIKPYEDLNYIKPGTGIAENIHGHHSQISLGQKHEISHFNTTLKKVKVLFPNAILVKRGRSLGGATVINAEGSNPETPADAIIIESTFTSTKDVIKNIVKKYIFLRILNFFVPSLKYHVLKWRYPNHDIHGIQPIDAIKNIRIPILLLGSKEDDIARYEHIRRLYKTARKSGNSRCHYFEVPHGKHANICWEKTDNTGIKILCVEHAFRKFYNLGNYDEKLAKAGWENFINNTQPTFE